MRSLQRQNTPQRRLASEIGLQVEKLRVDRTGQELLQEQIGVSVRRIRDDERLALVWPLREREGYLVRIDLGEVDPSRPLEMHERPSRTERADALGDKELDAAAKDGVRRLPVFLEARARLRHFSEVPDSERSREIGVRHLRTGVDRRGAAPVPMNLPQ